MERRPRGRRLVDHSRKWSAKFGFWRTIRYHFAQCRKALPSSWLPSAAERLTWTRWAAGVAAYAAGEDNYGPRWRVQMLDFGDLRFPAAVEAARPDGLIGPGWQPQFAAVVADARRRQPNVAIVAVHTPLRDGSVAAGVVQVVPDDAAIGRAAAAHLHSRRVGSYLVVGPRTAWSQERGRAALAGLRSLGIAGENVTLALLPADDARDPGRIAALLTKARRPVSVFCYRRLGRRGGVAGVSTGAAGGAGRGQGAGRRQRRAALPPRRRAAQQRRPQPARRRPARRGGRWTA